jgi:hypothetical protein
MCCGISGLEVVVCPTAGERYTYKGLDHTTALANGLPGSGVKYLRPHLLHEGVVPQLKKKGSSVF